MNGSDPVQQPLGISNLAEVKSFSEYDEAAILDLLRDELYPQTVKDIRRKLKHTGRDYPEYLLTRGLRQLISKDKVRFKGGRWMSPELFEQLHVTQTGYTPKIIKGPDLSIEGQTVPGYSGNNRAHDKNIEKDEYQSQKAGGPWAIFRKLLNYYAECVRSDEGADVSSYLSDLNKQFVFLNGVGGWFPKTGDSWNYIIPLGEHIEDFRRKLAQNAQDNVVVLGYPLEAVRVNKPNEGEYTFLRPVFYFILDAGFSNDSLTLSTTDAQPEISLEWLKHAIPNYSEQYHFLSACGLLNQPQPEDEAFGFTADDVRPGLEELVRTVAGFMPRRICEPLNPRGVVAHSLPTSLKSGIYNRAVIMMGTRGKYTQTLMRELRQIGSESDSVLAATSLAHIFSEVATPIISNKAEKPHEQVVAEVLPLNLEQREAVASLLHAEVSAITGPPGTGKSQVVVGAIANSRFNNKAVLFASRNHKAISAVVERLQDSHGRPLIIRANKPGDSSASYRFKNAIDDLLRSTIDEEARHSHLRGLQQLGSLLHVRGEKATLVEQIRAMKDQLGDFEEQLSWLKNALNRDQIGELAGLHTQIKEDSMKKIQSFLDLIAEKSNHKQQYSFLAWVRFWLRLFPVWHSTQRMLKHMPKSWHLTKFPPLSQQKFMEMDVNLLEQILKVTLIEKQIQPLESELKILPDIGDLIEEIDEQSIKIRMIATELLTLDLDSKGALPSDSQLREGIGSLKVVLNGLSTGFDNERQKSEAERSLNELIPVILENFPCWGVTNLSVGSHIPLVPGMFDLAILDEASQCDIASAIPILFRAKRAAVVGDPNQLKHVTKLSVSKDSLLRKRAEITELKDQRFSYKETSLYDLFAQTNRVVPHMLRETYRSCDEIAGYSNRTFYNGMLIVATNETQLTIPTGQKAGIHWTNIAAPIRSAGRSGCVCEEEIEAVHQLVNTILLQNNFKGSIGIVTPFRQQANRLNDRIFNGQIPYILLTGAQLDINTAHGFQGDERDVMIFSICGGPDMPQGSLGFLRESGNLFNVAVSRARAVLHVVGNLEWAKSTGIPHIMNLAHPSEKTASQINNSPWSPHESPWEKNLFEALVARGIEPIPQYPVAGRRLDMALVDEARGLKIDIEVDGDRYHRNPDGSRKKDDIWRDITLQGRGWKVIRFWVYRLRENMDQCIDEIEKAWSDHE